tara:strand:- start:418 stop:573 length:156 start_codon:yes stop_codon:yes gene_type:complete
MWSTFSVLTTEGRNDNHDQFLDGIATSAEGAICSLEALPSGSTVELVLSHG